MTARVALPFLLAVIAATFALVPLPSSRGPSSAPPNGATSATAIEGPPCPNEVLSLVNLKVGDALRDWSVTRLVCSEPRHVDVELARGDRRLVVIVAAEGAIPHQPPVRVGKLSLYYSQPQGAFDRDESLGLLEAMAVRVRGRPAPASW